MWLINMLYITCSLLIYFFISGWSQNLLNGWGRNRGCHGWQFEMNDRDEKDFCRCKWWKSRQAFYTFERKRVSSPRRDSLMQVSVYLGRPSFTMLPFSPRKASPSLDPLASLLFLHTFHKIMNALINRQHLLDRLVGHIGELDWFLLRRIKAHFLDKSQVDFVERRVTCVPDISLMIKKRFKTLLTDSIESS